MHPLASSEVCPTCAYGSGGDIRHFFGSRLRLGSGIIHSLGGGFSKSSLKGQYVISQTGIGVNQAGTAVDPFSETIVFTSDGSGNITVTVDDFDQVGGPFILSSSETGTYSIASDGTGSLVFRRFELRDHHDRRQPLLYY